MYVFSSAFLYFFNFRHFLYVFGFEGIRYALYISMFLLVWRVWYGHRALSPLWQEGDLIFLFSHGKQCYSMWSPLRIRGYLRGCYISHSKLDYLRLEGLTNRGYQPLTSAGMIHQVGRSNDFHHSGGSLPPPSMGVGMNPRFPSLLQAGWLAKPSMASAELAKVTELKHWTLVGWCETSCCFNYYCWWFRNPTPVEVGSLSHWFTKVLYAFQVGVWDFWTINSRFTKEFVMQGEWIILETLDAGPRFPDMGFPTTVATGKYKVGPKTGCKCGETTN